MSFFKTDALQKLVPFINVLLFAVYPIIALYAHNADQLKLKQILLPLFASLGLSVIIFILWKLILKKNLLASLATVFFLVLFWHYELINTGIGKIIRLSHWYLFPILGIIYFLLVYFTVKAKNPRTLKKLNVILLLPVSLLILINIAAIVSIEIKKLTISARGHQPAFIHDGAKEITHKPDIYLIVLDEYASFTTIEEKWGYDNNGFADFLEEKGFFVAKDSKTRFVSTSQAIPSIMNLRHLEENMERLERLHKYDNNFVFNFLNETGYEIVFLDGWGGFEFSFGIDNITLLCMYDMDFGPRLKLDEFSYLVFSQSMLRPASFLLRDENANTYYRANNHFFNYIEKYPLTANLSESPFLLYAHIMSPHMPYVFDRHGNFLENPTNYWEYENLDKSYLRDLYLEQYIFVTNKMIDIITEILNTSNNDPVIVLLSDHGPRRPTTGVEEAEHHHRILNAVYFPDGDYNGLYDDIDPVYTMRVLFNKYFGIKYELFE